MTNPKTRYAIFIENLAQDVCFLLFILVLLSVYRLSFVLAFRETLAPHTPVGDIFLTLWYGLRLSLKTAGACTLVPFILGTLVQAGWLKWPARKIRLIWGGVCCVGFALLFQTRLPYYQEFQQAFSPFIFNTMHDDTGAIIKTAIVQYQAVWRVLLGFVYAAVSFWGLKKVLFWAPKAAAKLAQPLNPTAVVVVFCVLLVPTAIFIRFGGSLSYNHSIYWKNAARMSQRLLNEAILDDVQALYRARKTFIGIHSVTRQSSPENVRAAAERLTGKPYTENSIVPLLMRTAKGAKIEKPRHIFVIVAETYMLWPLLDNYKELPIANGVRSLIARPDSVFIKHFLSASDGTMFGLTSVLTGLPELNMHTADQPSAQKPFETSLSTQLKKLGYKTRFFYGGYPSWNNLGMFINNQGFDESYYQADLGGNAGVWGMPDKQLFEQTAAFITSEPSFNYILNSTNHPPYMLDMTKEDVTQEAQLKQMLPAKAIDTKEKVQRMQAFEYGDKQLTRFVQEMYDKYPDSLFIITGDHADRWTLYPNPSLYERLAVPVIILGKGITKDMLPQKVSGAHQDIVPTIMELILPKGAPYYALGQDLLQGGQPGLHAYYYITDDVLGELGNENFEVLPGQTAPSKEELDSVHQRLQDEQTIAVWRVMHGTELN